MNNKSVFLKIKEDLIRNKILYIMIIPFILWYILFCYKPLWWILGAFKKYDNPWLGMMSCEWCGFDNFIKFFKSQYLYRTVKNTIVISLSQLIFGFPMPIIFAILLNEFAGVKFKKFVQTLSFLPHFISIVIICGMVTAFLSPSDGIVNILISKLGFEPHYFLIDKNCFVPIYVTMGIWQNTGFDAIVYIAALAGVDHGLYDACEIDGGGRFRRIISVTLPSILPTIVLMFILRLGSVLNVGAEAILLLYQPSTYETSDVISTYVYRMGIVSGNYGEAIAVSLLNSAISLVLVVSANKISKKITETSLW